MMMRLMKMRLMVRIWSHVNSDSRVQVALPSNLLTYHYRLIVISDEEDELVFWGPEDNREPHDETIVLKDLRVMLKRCDAMVPGECVLISVKKASVWFGVLLSRRKPCTACCPRCQTQGSGEYVQCEQTPGKVSGI